MKYWLVGDIHRNVINCIKRFKLQHPYEKPEDTCIICLGDYGVNIGGSSYEQDQKLKEVICSYGYHWYGNII